MADTDDVGAKVQGMLDRLDVSELVRRVGDAPPTWSLKKGSATVEISAGSDFVLASAKVLDGARRDDVELLRRLMQANVFMKGAFFSFEDEGTVRLSQVYPTDGLEDEVLAFFVMNVAEHADRADDMLRTRSWEKR